MLNPVRAGMVAECEAWPWSSYHAMTGLPTRPVWLQMDWMLAQFGAQRGVAIAAYMDFVRAGVGLPGIWNHLRGQV
jgi:hypothetical protein